LLFARDRGLWIIADEVYHRFYYDAPRSPSFYDVAEPDDPVSLRQHLLQELGDDRLAHRLDPAPPQLGQVDRKPSSNTRPRGSRLSCSARQPSPSTTATNSFATQVKRARRSREIVCSGLAADRPCPFQRTGGCVSTSSSPSTANRTPRSSASSWSTKPISDCPRRRLRRSRRGFLRLCFLRSPEQIEEATRRLVDWLRRR